MCSSCTGHLFLQEKSRGQMLGSVGEPAKTQFIVGGTATLRTWPRLQQLRCMLHRSLRFPVHVLTALEAGDVTHVGSKFNLKVVDPLFHFLPTCEALQNLSMWGWARGRGYAKHSQPCSPSFPCCFVSSRSAANTKQFFHRWVDFLNVSEGDTPKPGLQVTESVRQGEREREREPCRDDPYARQKERKKRAHRAWRYFLTERHALKTSAGHHATSPSDLYSIAVQATCAFCGCQDGTRKPA